VNGRPARRPKTTLVCGYGNPGRGDDGLGPALVARLEEEPGLRGRTDIRTETRLQLNIEDALTVSSFDRVIFADASTRGRAFFEFKRVRLTSGWSFSTHALAPGSVLGLCRELYGKTPQAFILGIRGYRWGLEDGLSDKAVRNLARAAAFLLKRLGSGGGG
jgi:hydrogenase maturation protease